MTIDELSKEGLIKILEASRDLIDSDFYEDYEIHRQTGLPMKRCKEMEEAFRVLKNLKL
jgi:hypothetical protein